MLPNNFKDRAKMAFNYADVDCKGSLTKRQYKIAMTAVFGCRPDKTEVRQAFQSTERISYELFELWVSKKCIANDSQVNAEVLFALLDRDYKGYLVLEDFYSASKAVDLKVYSPVWQMVFKELDRQRKGRLGFDEFLCILPAAYECTTR
ncbi:EF-hand calcium-binding domain-containing protein 11-like [Ceratina calcarata]|uniref:EF-hand calcium-binding domain-containing protein 11-like n=1 Tax=Ceratina calcarata TaxID=156304 RepID=A0AAJ7RZS9_9HYME|nr:EF-hand calcium-binding domain-containing protein 11-like [Ceratina calcarata]XP_026668726.1 EF-hand calcium-binding domain-containing protein 11-like [Ceratina calcarata]